MAEKSVFDWTENIQQYQQAYVDAWQAFLPDSKQTGNGQANAQATPGGPENPWVDAMNQWWQGSVGDSPQPAQQFYEKMVEQGQSFLQLAENFQSAFQNVQTGSQATSKQWEAFIEQATANFQQVFSHSAWQMPLSNWQQVMSSLSFLPGDSFQGMDFSGLDFTKDSFQNSIDKLLSTPGVGQHREKQEQQQKLAKLLLAYQAAVQDYAQTQSEIGLLSVRKFQERLTTLAQGDPAQSLTSFKQVYDCWVDCCEEVYAEYVMSDKYVAVHGNMVNTLLAVKQQGRLMVDETLGMLNMPTRREIDTLHGRLHQLRRAEKAQLKQFEALKTELMGLIHQQAEKIQGLQQQLDQSTSAAKPTRQPAAAKPAAGTAPKKAARKPAAAKKTTTPKTTAVKA